MSIWWVAIGTVIQLIIAGVLVMLTITFGASAMTSKSGEISKTIMTLAVLVLPALPVIGALKVIYEYVNDGGYESFWWYLPPLVIVASYFMIMDYILDRKA